MKPMSAAHRRLKRHNLVDCAIPLIRRKRKAARQPWNKARPRALGHGVVYEFANGTGCFLYSTPNAGTSSASQAFWEVADVASEVAELKAKGVVFETYDMPGMQDGILTAGGAKTAWFKDTEGNILAVVQTI